MSRLFQKSTRMHSIACERCNRYAVQSADPQYVADRTEDAGFRRFRGKHYCPTCWQTLRERR